MDDRVFDMTDVDQATIDGIAYVLSSPAWERFFRPFIEYTTQSLMDQLVDPTQKRKWDRPDDYLRGGIIYGRALLNFPQYILDENREKLADEERVSEERAHYNERAQSGTIGPMGFRKMDDPEEY